MQEMVIEVLPDAHAAGAARAAVADWASRHAAATQDQLALVVSELVTNAVQHGPDEPVGLHLAVDGSGRVTGTVIDQGEDVDAVVRRSPSADQGGFGLTIVDELATDWGVRHGSVAVWFILDPPAS